MDYAGTASVLDTYIRVFDDSQGFQIVCLRGARLADRLADVDLLRVT